MRAGIQWSCATQYNAAAAEKRAAEAALAAAPNETIVGREDLEAYIDQLHDSATALDSAEPEELSELYSSLRLSDASPHRSDRRRGGRPDGGPCG